MKDLHLGPQAALESVPVTEQLSPMPPVLPSELPTHSPDTLRGMQADTPQGFSRRRFLGLLGGLTAGAVAASTVAAKLEWSTSAITTALYGPDPEAVPSEVPAELRGKAIPRTNEHYRVSPMSVLQDGLQGYIGAGGKPFYRRPDFYMSQADALQAALAGTMEDGSIELAHSRTTGPMLRFTRNYYTKPFSLLDNDPGTTSGIAAQRLKDTAQREAERNTTDNTDALAKRRHKLAADIAETYAGHFADTKDYIDAIKGDGRVSTSELFRYSLDQTEGDIFRSLLDTTLFLKLASRVDITALSHVAQQSAPDKVRIKGATYEGAQLLSSLFYDEFSNQVP